MRIFGLIFLLIYNYSNLFSQRGNNWTSSSAAVGLNFNTSPPTIFPKSRPYRECAQTISNCKGELQLYTQNQYIYNANHQLLKHLPSGTTYFNLLIPKPGDDSAFYYFRGDDGTHKYGHYFEIDMRGDSGRGDMDTTVHMVIDSGILCVGFVKHANDTDYWLLIKTNIYTVNAFLVTKNGISTSRVPSKMIGTNANFYFRFSNNGNYVIAPSTYGQVPPINDDRTYIYNYNTKTGKCSNERLLFSDTTKTTGGYYCFSPNDSIIYQFLGQFDKNVVNNIYSINQFETYNSNIVSSQASVFSLTPKGTNSQFQYDHSQGIQLAPDNKMYFWLSDSNANSHCLSYIEHPDIKGLGCNVRYNGFCSPNDTLSFESFPDFFFPIKRINNHFAVTGANGCVHDGDSLRFMADTDTAFKSYTWHFGDGDSAVGKSVVHQYKNPGSYYVKLGCVLGSCGYMQWVGDSVTIKFKPTVSLNTNKTIYCGYQTITAQINYRYSDTVQLAWGDGTDTLLYVTDTNLVDSVQLQHLYTKSGNYAISCKAWNSSCYDSVATIYNIIIDTFPKASFSADYITSCGAKSIILTDTSKFDSIIVNRTWHTYKPSGFDTTITTGTTTNVSVLFNDTGVYSVKLIVLSRQGCIDSLEKINYIQINQVPVSKISGKTSWCGVDSTTLTVAGGSAYKWSTGDTTASVFLKPITSNYYSVTVTNVYNCSVKDSVYISVGKIVSPLFKPDYLTSCGNSTITLTDSSGGRDSIIQQRRWTIEYPNNIIKQYDTVSSNKLKLIVQDTGYYNAKLVYLTRQGCMDSLTKTNVFRILPQPVVYIDSPSHNPLCFGDSFILTAKQKDINYPPLVKYKWNTGPVNTPSIIVDSSNSYYVSATNAYGCGAQSNTVKIDILPQLFANIKTAKDRLYVIATRPIASYTWYKDNVLYDSTSSIYFPPTGRYYVHVVDGNGCIANSNSLQHTGMNYLEHIDNWIRVYPNPVSDMLYIEYPPILVGEYTNQRQQRNIVIYDMLGKKVYNTITNGERLYSISIGHLPKGLYILSVGEEKVKLAVE